MVLSLFLQDISAELQLNEIITVIFLRVHSKIDFEKLFTHKNRTVKSEKHIKEEEVKNYKEY